MKIVKKILCAFLILVFFVISCLVFESIARDFHRSYVLNYEDSDISKFKAYKKMISSNLDEKSIDYHVKGIKYYQDSVLLSKFFDKMAGKNATTSLVGTSNNLMDAEDVVVQLSDGYLSLITDSVNVDSALSKTVSFAKKLKENGIDFIYYELPRKLDTSDKGYLSYRGVYPDYTKETEDKIRNRLEEEGIEVLSFEQAFPEINNNRKSYFFVTDHHWLPETGLIASKILAQRLNESHGFDIDLSLFDLNRFNTDEKYEMMGSLGNKVTKIYSKKEKMSLLIPKYHTDIRAQIPNLKYNQTGKFEDVLYNRSNVQENPYTIYARGNNNIFNVTNNLVHNGKRILILKTSMANVVIPFMSLGIEYVDALDIRSFRRDVMQYIEKTKPDTVIMVYGTREFFKPNSFNF